MNAADELESLAEDLGRIPIFSDVSLLIPTLYVLQDASAKLDLPADVLDVTADFAEQMLEQIKRTGTIRQGKPAQLPKPLVRCVRTIRENAEAAARESYEDNPV